MKYFRFRPGLKLAKVLALLSLSLVAALAPFAVCADDSILDRLGRSLFQNAAPESGGMDAASKPVVTGSNTVTAAVMIERSRDFRVRTYLDGFRDRGEHHSETDALATGLLSNWIACNFNGTVNTNLPPLDILADQLATNPACTDPLVQMVAAINSVELHEGNKRLERAVKAFDGSKHRAYPKFFGVVTLAGKIIDDREDRIPVLDASALKYLRQSLADGSVTTNDQPLVGETLVHDWGRQFFDRNPDEVIAVFKDQGPAYAWLASVLTGEAEISRAWQARGGGYANTVSPAGWEGFSKHLAIAREQLTSAWRLHPEWPLAPARMIYVSMGDADITEMRRWFDLTTTAQIDYPEAWNDMRWALRPRWFGNEAAMLAFGRTALNSGRFDTDVPRKYMDTLADLKSEESLPAGTYLFGRRDIWPDLQKMYQGYVAASTNDEQRGWCSTYATVAYLAGKIAVARDQLSQLDWSPNKWNLTGWCRDLSLMAPEVAARTSPQGDAINAAEAKRDANDFEGALNIYHGVQLATLGKPARVFVTERLKLLDSESRLQNGQWVDFLPATANFTGWEMSFGEYRVLPDGALEVQADKNGHMAYSRVRMGTDFEVRGQFELVNSSDKQFQWGLVMGVPQFESDDWYAFRVKHTDAEGDVVSFSQGWTQRQVMSHPQVNATTNSFTFRLHQGRVSATLNGQEVFHEVNLPPHTYVTTNEFVLGVGAFNDSNDTVIRYRSLQARKL
jgi:hypothetical protein